MIIEIYFGGIQNGIEDPNKKNTILKEYLLDNLKFMAVVFVSRYKTSC